VVLLATLAVRDGQFVPGQLMTGFAFVAAEIEACSKLAAALRHWPVWATLNQPLARSGK